MNPTISAHGMQTATGMRGLEQIPWLYDVCFWFMERCGLGRWRRWLTRGARGRTLEVGCGTGRNLSLYAADVQLIALDPDPHVIPVARRRSPTALFVRASAEALPFRDGAFDTVVSGLVFCSVPNPKHGLVEVARVLAASGRLRMIEHVRASWRWRGWWQDLIQPLWVWLIGGCHSNRDTERTLREAGFTIEERAAFDNFRKLVAAPPAEARPTVARRQPASRAGVAPRIRHATGSAR